MSLLTIVRKGTHCFWWDIYLLKTKGGRCDKRLFVQSIQWGHILCHTLVEFCDLKCLTKFLSIWSKVWVGDVCILSPSLYELGLTAGVIHVVLGFREHVYKPSYRNIPLGGSASRPQRLTPVLLCWAACGTSTEPPCSWKHVLSMVHWKSVRTQISFVRALILRGRRWPEWGLEFLLVKLPRQKWYYIEKDPCSDSPKPGERWRWEEEELEQGSLYHWPWPWLIGGDTERTAQEEPNSIMFVCTSKEAEEII